MATATDVVEIGLLLPANRVDALIALSRKRRKSVGQLLRTMIDRALLDGEDADASHDPCDGSGAGAGGPFA